jgi:allophanate hydrolase
MSMVEIRAPGVMASVQDAGRFGWRRTGVPWSGALDRRLLRLANALVGNPEAAPAIECIDGGLCLVAHGGPVRLAVAGAAALQVLGSDGVPRAARPWRSLTLAEGEGLRVADTGPGRVAMVAVAGLSLAPVLGSAATYARARLGGLDGAALAAGDRLPAGAVDGPERHLAQPPRDDGGPIRVVPGPQADHFAPGALAAFLAGEWTLTPAADRMGLRLAGAPLRHATPAQAQIVSDAIVPGAIQVPGNGQPIVLLADSQTAGGYPKIATVISADLGRVAACRPGSVLRFCAVTVAEAEGIARAGAAALQRLLAAIVPVAAEAAVDLEALYRNNLLSGMVNALLPRMDDDPEPEGP